MIVDDSRQAIVRRFFEAGWNSEDLAAISDIVHEAYDSNDGGFFRSGSGVPGGLERLTGVDAFADHVTQYREMYNDLQLQHRQDGRRWRYGDCGLESEWDHEGADLH